jgi:hypothetical protein
VLHRPRDPQGRVPPTRKRLCGKAPEPAKSQTAVECMFDRRGGNNQECSENV